MTLIFNFYTCTKHHVLLHIAEMQGMHKLTLQRTIQAQSKQQLPKTSDEDKFCHRTLLPSEQ